MSDTFLDNETWPEGIAAARIPANNNSRRYEAFVGPAISATTAAQPGSPAELDIYIIPAAATGTQWAGFDEGDVAIYHEATWTAFVPFEGLRKFVIDEGEDWQFYGDSSGGWAPAAAAGTVTSVNGSSGAVVLTQGDIVSTINDETASYTAVLSDEVVIMDNASANNFTVPPNSSVAFPVGCSLEVWQKGAGQTTIVAGSGVTILYAATYTLKLNEQNSGCSLRKVATDTWRLIGDMEPL